jgi:quinol monooxygenase YgiN
MLAKLIKCRVAQAQREAFSKAQEAWSETANCHGFNGQIGGWCESQAIALALWQDRQSVDSFMQQHHDAIYDKSGQGDTYLDCKVAYLDKVMTIPSVTGQTPCIDGQTEFIRIVDCEVLPHRHEHFLDVQQTLWNPGMAAVKGMLGGYCWQYQNNPSRFVITTFWQNKTAHDGYLKDSFPALKSAAKVNDDINAMTGYLIDVVPQWLVG